MSSSKDDLSCSFCGKGQKEVKKLIAGPNTYICNECVDLCCEIIEDEKEEQVVAEDQEYIPPPHEIKSQLDSYVIDQDQAKKYLSVAVYNHYKRIWNRQINSDSDIELQKTNILLVGPTGCGKTLLAETLARTLDVPFAVCDATSLTESGYVGEDVENILLRLIQAADWDIGRAEHGIVYIDELDKISRKEGINRSITRDVSGEGVQQELLKIIEGCVANVPPQGGRKHPHQEFLQIDTHHILFICGGAFDGLEDIVSRRVGTRASQMGFLSDRRDGIESSGSYFTQVIPEDLLHFGFIPEMVGRLPVTVGLEPLDKESLIQVLTKPKNSILKQYQHLFRIDNVDLEFTEDALEAAAERALNHQTGARCLRYVIEDTLLDVMYDLPSIDQAVRCIVSREAIEGKSPPNLYGIKGEEVHLPLHPIKKSA